MKKFISLALTLIMILSLVSVFVTAAPSADSVGKVASGYAPEGTGIDSLDKITDPAGKYYLTADIIVNATYTTEFTGTLDGNGKKITTTVALFEKVNNATIKNFVIEGSISLTAPGVTAGGAEDFYAAVAIIANGKTTFSNILSDVDIATTSANTRIAAIAATSEADYDLVLDTCVNKGDISVVKYAGGVYGWTAKKGTAVVKNCSNYGKISSTGGYIGGVINRICGTGGSLTVSDCANYGEVVSTGGNSSGILAYHYKSDLTITNCVNEGKIDSTSAAAGITASPSCENGGNTLTIKNCTNKGAISGGSQMGGIVAYANVKVGTILIENCVNEGAVTGKGQNAYGAGIIGRAGHDDGVTGETSITVKNCTNKGTILVGKDQGGGIMGYDCMKTSTYVGCTNYGKIGAIEGAKRSQAGGIMANHRQGAANKVIIKDCVNYGELTSLDHHAGGMAATSNVLVEITNCVNYGKVTVVMTATSGINAGGLVGNLANPGAENRGVQKITKSVNSGEIVSDDRAGGLIGYAWGANEEDVAKRTYVEVQNCINTAKVTGKSVVSQLVAYTNSDYTTIKNNLAIGSVVANGADAKTVFVAGSTADLSKYNVSGNYFAENDGTAYYTYTATEENAANIVEIANKKEGSIITATAAQLASGEVTYALNQAIGSDVFRQTLGSDKAPTLSTKSAVVIKNDEGAFENKVVATGDSTLVIVFALLAISTGAVLTLKKKNAVR